MYNIYIICIKHILYMYVFNPKGQLKIQRNLKS